MKNLVGLSFSNGISANSVGFNKPTIHIDLDPGSLIAVPNGWGLVVRCQSGALWITQLDNHRDLELHAGESMAIEKGRDTLIRAVAATSVELDPAGVEESRLTMDLRQGCHALKHAVTKQAMKVRGKCRIRMAGNGSAVCVQ
jgi:hypothetical protein